MNNLAQKLLKLRKHYNYSQRFVADVLNVDVLEYMGYENGRSVMGFAKLKTLAKFYHISVIELFDNNMEVTIHDISNTHTDEVNIEYFLPPKSKSEKIKEWLFKNRLFVIVSCVVAIIFIAILLFIPRQEVSNLSLTMVDKNRLDASETSVVYIDDNMVVKGSGDNSNGQLNLNFNNIVKVEEGMTFTVVLDEEGKLDSTGLMQRYANEIKRWNNIVDVACGDGHIIALNSDGEVFCTGDNMYSQCDVAGTTGVKNVFATSRGSIIVNNDGTLTSSGDFFGRSSLNNHQNIVDIDSSDNILVLLDDEGRVHYYSSGRNYNDVAFFENIVDVACGNDFIAALSNDGHVYIDIDNYLIEEEVADWENIIAIASGSDYLVGYDGHSIHGVGNNSYKQFESSTVESTYRLPQVKNIHVVVDQNYVNIQFDEVDHADSYLVEVDLGTGFSAVIDNTICTIDASRFEDGRSYNIQVTAIGRDEYSDSIPASTEFTFHKVEIEEPIESDDTVDVVEIPFALDSLIGKTKTNFEIYLNGLGIDESQMEGIESENICEGDEAIIESVTGISEYELVTKKELQERHITYTYCKVGE